MTTDSNGPKETNPIKQKELERSLLDNTGGTGTGGRSALEPLPANAIKDFIEGITDSIVKISLILVAVAIISAYIWQTVDIHSINKSIENLSDDITDTDDSVKELSDIVETVDENVEDLNEKIEDLSGEVEDLDDNIEELNEAQNATKEEVKNLKTEISNLKK